MSDLLQCVFDDISQPCGVCVQRGLNCGRAEKIFARDYISLRTLNGSLAWIRKGLHQDVLEEETTMMVPMDMLPAPADTLSSADSQFMTYYWRTSGMWFDLINDVKSGANHALAGCVARRFGPHISSSVVRSAFLYYSSYRIEGGNITCQGMIYLSTFCQEARKAIEMEQYVEVMYACYTICLYEMTSKRFFTNEFAKHAQGFLLCVEKGRNNLTYEEQSVMLPAYDLISNALDTAQCRWSDKGNWLDFVGTVVERLECANARLLNANAHELGDNGNSTKWIPLSHPLFRAECLVHQLSTLFNLLGQNDKTIHEIEKKEIKAAVRNCLKGLWDIVSEPIPRDSYDDDELMELRLAGNIKLLGDNYTRQLLYIYYVFSLQNSVLNSEWSENICTEAIEIASTVCRLYSSPHISTFPAADIRFLANRGLVIAGLVAVEGMNILSTSTLKRNLI
jgi:hypothetical protein